MAFLKLLFLFLLFPFGLQNAMAQVSFSSPGPLAKPHETIDSPSKCGACHEKGKQTSNQLCLDCHKELNGGMANKKGLHGLLPLEGMLCAKCHPDHVSREFALIDWGENGIARFEHTRAGFELVGAHGKLACDQCHKNAFVSEPAIIEMLKVEPGRKTYLGLSTQCSSCHVDEHRGQVSKKCETCHTENAWKPAADFDHNQARFLLTGKHRTATCIQCHIRIKDESTGKTYMKMVGIPFSSCEDCHKDVHVGKFGKECQSCHSTGAWNSVGEQVVPTPKGRDFHEKTKFPLRGAHQRVACESCHNAGKSTKPKFKGLKFSKCSDCHLDAHFGQITKALWNDCADCHSVFSFERPDFTIQDHAKTHFPLVGGHIAVPCNACHTPTLRTSKRSRNQSPAVFKFKKSLQACETCHIDPHGGQFQQKGAVKTCVSCHDLRSFKALRFNHARDTQYPLTGKHKVIPCLACHTKNSSGVARYRGLPMHCEGCHEDVHLGQFVPTAPGVPLCETCHTTEDFKKEMRFNHNNKSLTSFPLEGKHSKVPCNKCHFEIDVGKGLKALKFNSIPTACHDCHIDPHKGLFNEVGQCEKCHTPVNWHDAGFDHSKTKFPLVGKHQRVSCRQCHIGGEFQKQTDKTCGACHVDPHASQLGLACTKCHDETDWKSNHGIEAHRRTNFPLTGRHATLPCQECHTDIREKTFSRVALDCFSCHSKDYDAAASKGTDHTALGYSTNCRQCHTPSQYWSSAKPPAP